MKYLLDYTDNFLCSTEAKVIKICQKLCILVSYTFALSDFIKSKIASNTKPEQKKALFTHLVIKEDTLKLCTDMYYVSRPYCL